MDVTSIFKAVFALAMVLGLILALAYVLRRYAPNVLARLSAPRGRKRLQVIETLVLDPTRRVIIVRVDDEERLILLGEGRELIEPRPHVETTTKPVEPAVAPQPTPRPRPVAVATASQSQPSQSQPSQSQPSQSQATPSRVKLTAARAAYPRPTVQDPNDDLF
jgi:flagellar protein FliO/FliZ